MTTLNRESPESLSRMAVTSPGPITSTVSFSCGLSRKATPSAISISSGKPYTQNTAAGSLRNSRIRDSTSWTSGFWLSRDIVVLRQAASRQ